MKREPNNGMDVIDSRDIIERIKELDELRQAVLDATAELEAADEKDEAEAALAEAQEEFDDDAQEELAALEKLQEEAEGYAADWRHGEALVRESHFVAYCQDMLDDCGDLPKDLPPYIVIDWEATADNIRADYTDVDYDGETYLIR